MKLKLTNLQRSLLGHLAASDAAALPWSFFHSVRKGHERKLWSYCASGGIIVIVPLGADPMPAFYKATNLGFRNLQHPKPL